MKRLARLVPFALAVMVATPALSQKGGSTRLNPNFASDYQTIPTTANVPGLQGATWATQVSILNPTSSGFDVTATLHDNQGTTRTASITLAAGEQKTYLNFLQEVFQFSGAGALRFQSPPSTGGTHNNRFILSAEVWTSSGGRFGTTVPVTEFEASDSPSYAAGITVDDSNRTNVGCFNRSESANHVKATIFDGSKREVGTVDVNLAANAWGQTGVGARVTGGFVRFEPSGPAVCWAVVVNNDTNDGRYISAEEYLP